MTAQSEQPADRALLDDLEALKVYFDPLRQRIVQEVSVVPRTVQEIAEALDVPFTRLYYHIRLLEQHGIIRVVDVRSGAGAIEEKTYQIAARQFVIARHLLTHGPLDEDRIPPGLEVILDTVLARPAADIRDAVRRDVIDLRTEAPHPDALFARRGLFRLDRDQISQFQTELIALLNRYFTVEPGPNQPRDYQLAVALHPLIFTADADPGIDSRAEREPEDEPTC